MYFLLDGRQGQAWRKGQQNKGGIKFMAGKRQMIKRSDVQIKPFVIEFSCPGDLGCFSRAGDLKTSFGKSRSKIMQQMPADKHRNQ